MDEDTYFRLLGFIPKLAEHIAENCEDGSGLPPGFASAIGLTPTEATQFSAIAATILHRGLVDTDRLNKAIPIVEPLTAAEAEGLG